MLYFLSFQRAMQPTLQGRFAGVSTSRLPEELADVRVRAEPGGDHAVQHGPGRALRHSLQPSGLPATLARTTRRRGPRQRARTSHHLTLR